MNQRGNNHQIFFTEDIKPNDQRSNWIEFHAAKLEELKAIVVKEFGR